MSSEMDRLSAKFSRTMPVLIQLYPDIWNTILDRFEKAMDRGVPASKAIRAVNLCKGLAEHNRLALLAALAEDRREIQRGQGNFHRPMTEVTLADLAGGKTPGFFSYLPDTPAPRRSGRRQPLPLTDPHARQRRRTIR